MWKLIYGLITIKEGEEDPFEARNNGEEDDNNKEGEGEKEKADDTVEKETQKDDMATAKEKKTKQSVQDTQFPPPSPPHVTPTPVDTINVQDVPENFVQNINPLTAEDLKRILHQTTLQDQLCTNPVLVSVEELQKVVADITRDKVNPQEPPSHIPTNISGQPMEQIVVDTSANVDCTNKITTTVKETVKDQTRKMDTFVPTA